MLQRIFKGRAPIGALSTVVEITNAVRPPKRCVRFGGRTATYVKEGAPYYFIGYASVKSLGASVRVTVMVKLPEA